MDQIGVHKSSNSRLKQRADIKSTSLEVQTAVVLVGGEGLRMRPLTEGMPKCMVSLHGRPMVYWTLKWLKNSGFDHVVLGVAYRKESVINFMLGNPVGIDVDFSEHTVEGGTGEGFRLAIERYVDDENFLAMNGDELTNLDLGRFCEFHLKYKPVATIAVAPTRSPFGILELDGNNVEGFTEKPIFEDKLASIGVYIFNRAILRYLPRDGSIEKTTFPLLAKNRLLKAYKLCGNERWLTVNSIKDLSMAEEEFSQVRGL